MLSSPLAAGTWKNKEAASVQKSPNVDYERSSIGTERAAAECTSALVRQAAQVVFSKQKIPAVCHAQSLRMRTDTKHSGARASAGAGGEPDRLV